MPRPPRPIDEGLVYHVINRGNNGAQVFFRRQDYAAFLEALADLKQRRPFELYGYCLMRNHFHLLLRVVEAPISRIMQSLLVSHTQRYHRFRHSGGHVWQGRFKSPVVQDDEHLLLVLRYIEANPLRGEIVEQAAEYPWSSFRAHGLGQRDDLLDPVVPYEAFARTAAARQRRWSTYVHKMPQESELEAIRLCTQRGFPFGESAWVKALGKRLGLEFIIRPRGRPRNPRTAH